MKIYGTEIAVYTVRQKKESIFLYVHLFSVCQKLLNFLFTYIRPKESRSISYNSVYLILACAENFAVTVTLDIFVYQSSNEDYRLVFIVSISLLCKILNARQNEIHVEL